MELKIGDTVTATFLEGKWEIIADKDHPYMGLGASPFNQPIKVKDGSDFIINRLDIVLKPGELSPFQHVPKSHLKKIK